MKKLSMLLLIVGTFAASTTSFAQIRKIPAEVTEAFKSKFPEAKNVEWQDKLTVFEATFEQANTRHQATYNNKGEWQSTEKFITESDLPQAVKDGVTKSKYHDWEMKSFVWVDSKDDGERYRIYAERAALNKKYLYFNKQGQLQKESITL